MKRIIWLVLLCMSICWLYIYFLWSSYKWQPRQISYVGSISHDNKIFITNNFSGIRNNTGSYILDHSLSFLDKEKEMLSVNLTQQQEWWNNYLIPTNYMIVQSTGNNRLHIFTDELLSQHINQKVSLPDEGLEYHTTYQKWLLSDNMYITGTYVNQFREKNTFEVTIQSYCGLTQYRAKRHKCNINWNVVFFLPINTTTTQRTIDWTLTQQFK